MLPRTVVRAGGEGQKGSDFVNLQHALTQCSCRSASFVGHVGEGGAATAQQGNRCCGGVGAAGGCVVKGSEKRRQREAHNEAQENLPAKRSPTLWPNDGCPTVCDSRRTRKTGGTTRARQRAPMGRDTGQGVWSPRSSQVGSITPT